MAAALPPVLTADVNGSPIFIRRLDGGPIDPSATSWLIIHGWNSSPTTFGIATLAAAVQQARPNQQVLTLDWSNQADNGSLDPFGALDQVPDVAAVAERLMADAGWHFRRLKIVAHSYGSYVGAEIAARTPAGIDGIIALDPGRNVNLISGYDPDASVDFASHTHLSWAFYSPTGTSATLLGDVSLGDPTTAATADDAFVAMNTTHVDVPVLYANMLRGPDLVSHRFSLASFLAEDHGTAHAPWRPNHWDSDGTHGGDFEAVVQTSNQVTPFSIQYVRASDGVAVVEDVTAIGVAADGTLVVPGTLGGDTIFVTRAAPAATPDQATPDRVIVARNGAAPESFATAHVRLVSVYGSAGPDAIVIGPRVPPALVAGNGGNDTLIAGDAGDTLLGGVGFDSLVGGAADDSIAGGPGDDTILGNAGNDTISAGGGNDVVDAGPGDDLVFARDGLPDALHGGGGSDTVHADAVDVVTDFALVLES